MSTCILYLYYSNTTNRVTRAINTISARINLQMYFNHVVYGTFIYPNAKIKIILVGPTILNTPYIPWNNIATDEYIDSSVIRLSIGENIPPTI